MRKNRYITKSWWQLLVGSSLICLFWDMLRIMLLVNPLEHLEDSSCVSMLRYCQSDSELCDCPWDKPAYVIHAQFVQCVFIVPQAKSCQSPNFVTFHIFFWCYCCLFVSNEGEVSLHFDLPSVYNHTWSLLLKAIIRVRVHRLSRYTEIHWTAECWLKQLLMHWRKSGSCYR